MTFHNLREINRCPTANKEKKVTKEAEYFLFIHREIYKHQENKMAEE